MNIDEIHLEWENDCDINIAQLSEEVRRVPKLHAKYYRYYTSEHSALRKMKAEHTKLIKLKTEYYSGDLALEDLKDLGWEPNAKKILRGDIPTHVESDSQVIKHKLLIGEQDEKVQLIESIINALNNRGYLLKTALDFERFRTGAT